MNEKAAKKLFRGITGIDDAIIEEALADPPVRRAPVWRRWGAVAACLCVVALVVALVWRAGRPVSWDIGGDGGANIRLEASGCNTLPGGITPILRVGDTLYQWTGIAQPGFVFYGDGRSYLPEGYQPIGDISGITLKTPAKSLQLQAGFEASGTVFVNEEFPAVVYTLMTTGWFEDTYIRFVSDALGDNELLSWQGRMYRFSYDFNVCGVLEELPEDCELVGNLHFVGKDSIPTGDLETNHGTDNYFRLVEGREVYAIPGDDSALYVYEHHYWREGDYPTWRECRLWDE